MTFIWIQTNARRYKAWCSKIAEIGHYLADDRLFETMWDQFLRPETTTRKEDIQRKSYERTSVANAKQRAMDSEKQKNNAMPAFHPSAKKKNSSMPQRSLMVNFSSLPDIVAVQNPYED